MAGRDSQLLRLGDGLLYAGRRSFLGVSLLVFAATVFLGVPALASDPLRAASLLLAAWLAVSTALAWDAYSEVKGNEKGKGRGRLRTG